MVNAEARAYHISLSSALESTVLSSLPHSVTLMADVCPLNSALTGEERGRRRGKGVVGRDGKIEREGMRQVCVYFVGMVYFVTTSLRNFVANIL